MSVSDVCAYGNDIKDVHTRCFENLRVWDSRLELPADNDEPEIL